MCDSGFYMALRIDTLSDPSPPKGAKMITYIKKERQGAKERERRVEGIYIYKTVLVYITEMFQPCMHIYYVYVLRNMKFISRADIAMEKVRKNERNTTESNWKHEWKMKRHAPIWNVDVRIYIYIQRRIETCWMFFLPARYIFTMVQAAKCVTAFQRLLRCTYSTLFWINKDIYRRCWI